MIQDKSGAMMQTMSRTSFQFSCPDYLARCNKVLLAPLLTIFAIFDHVFQLLTIFDNFWPIKPFFVRELYKSDASLRACGAQLRGDLEWPSGPKPWRDSRGAPNDLLDV